MLGDSAKRHAGMRMTDLPNRRFHRFDLVCQCVADVAQRVALLERYEQWRKPTRVDFATLVGKDEWDAYWKSRDAMIAEMMRCQAVADRILATVEQRMR
jgi:hypothetical protein